MHFLHISHSLLSGITSPHLFPSPPLYPTLRIPLQFFLNPLHLLRIPNLNNPIDLCRIPHQLLGASVQHLDFGVACDGEVVQHDVGDGLAARVLSYIEMLASRVYKRAGGDAIEGKGCGIRGFGDVQV
jgi:hypothetical protein